MRTIPIIVLGISILMTTSPAWAASQKKARGFSLGAGYNQASKNEAKESIGFSLKDRLTKYEYGLDLCMSKARGGVGRNDFGFLWGAWYDDFARPKTQEYGIYVGAGAGIYFLQQNFVKWPAGPFAILGWDLTRNAGLEGKVGYYGDHNFWGTANFYWNWASKHKSSGTAGSAH